MKERSGEFFPRSKMMEVWCAGTMSQMGDPYNATEPRHAIGREGLGGNRRSLT